MPHGYRSTTVPCSTVARQAPLSDEFANAAAIVSRRRKALNHSPRLRPELEADHGLLRKLAESLERFVA